MHLQVHGKQIDVGDALRTHTTDKLSALVAKYFDREAHGTVTYSREGGSFVCDALLHLPSGMNLQASAQSHEVYGAFDEAAARLESRLKRYVGRLKRHHKERTGPIETVTASAYVIEGEKESDSEGIEPVIIAELTAEIRNLTVGEAVLQMNLQDVQALMFRNRGNDRLNLVYRRSDGHIGWIDPPEIVRK